MRIALLPLLFATFVVCGMACVSGGPATEVRVTNDTAEPVVLHCSDIGHGVRSKPIAPGATLVSSNGQDLMAAGPYINGVGIARVEVIGTGGALRGCLSITIRSPGRGGKRLPPVRVSASQLQPGPCPVYVPPYLRTATPAP